LPESSSSDQRVLRRIPANKDAAQRNPSQITTQRSGCDLKRVVNSGDTPERISSEILRLLFLKR
jgi:hypothetical protein